MLPLHTECMGCSGEEEMALLQPLTGAGLASLGQSQKEGCGAHCMACDVGTKFISDLVPSG